MSVPLSAPVGNRLLTNLSPEVQSQLQPHLALVELRQRQVIYKPDGPIDAVYFPEVGMISMVATLADGGAAEVGVVGPEGMAGIGLLSGVTTSFVECMVQMPGAAWRMNASAFRQEIETNAPVLQLMLRYTEALQAQVMQTAACNGRHGLEAKLCRWLLMCHDRADGDEVQLTQEFIAMMLGVHRPSVTMAARTLQSAGLIRYRGGRVTVLDRVGLEAATCECYATVRRRYETVVGFSAIRR
jgi:CRP-like cAMP-binding protein